MRSKKNANIAGRYAPSPTGPQHLGNLRTALLAWLQVRLAGGIFIVRMEDLDEPRSRPGAAVQILEDLRWLGLDWDEGPDCGGPAKPYLQSERKAVYRQALRHLAASGCVFRCSCSRKDIQAAASAPHGSDGPVYPGRCRADLLTEFDLSAEQTATQDPVTTALRVRVDQHIVEFDDLICGPQRFEMAHSSGDFVIRRKDGLFAYQLAVAVDDTRMGISDVLRGEDLLDSTARQVLLLSLLGEQSPRYWHVPLMNDAGGNRLSKRDESTSIEQYRAAGMSAADLVGRLAASVGFAEPGSSMTPVELLNRVGDRQNFMRALKLTRTGTGTLRH